MGWIFMAMWNQSMMWFVGFGMARGGRFRISVPSEIGTAHKSNLTFTDAIGAVRLALWVGDIYRHSPSNREKHKIPPDRLVRMAETLCFAA
jgi:hypothetical protein